MTRDQIINLAIGRLIKQGVYGTERPSRVGCVYLSRDKKRRCVVGVLLDDETAWNFGELGAVSEIPVATFPLELRPHIHLLERMQSIHDGSVTEAVPFHEFILELADLPHDQAC